MSNNSRRSAPLPNGWDRKRRRILRRDANICYVCHKAGATEVDHIVPVSRGGGDEDMNLAAICKDCHASKTGREARGGTRRREPEQHPGLVNA